MFCAFEGPPQIVRLFGYGSLYNFYIKDHYLKHVCLGKVYEFGTPKYCELIPVEKRQPGSRAVIMLDIHKVGTVSVTIDPSISNVYSK